MDAVATRGLHAEDERVGGPRCCTTTYDDDALALSMQVFSTACDMTRTHVVSLADTC